MEKPDASTPTSPNVVVYRGLVNRPRREQQNGHLVEEELHRAGIRTYAFDGDNVRHGLCGDLSFSREGRAENLRRIGEMVKLFLDAGTVCLTAFISPLAEDRHKVRQIIGEGDFFEIFVKCPLEVCEERDVKGLYKLARAGKIKNYTGISAPYEEPQHPDLLVETDRQDIDACVQTILAFIMKALQQEHP